MKKLLAVSAIAALGLNSVVLAGGLPEEMPMAPAAVSTSDAGVYFGVEGGFGMTNWKQTGSNVGTDNGIVGRALLGYDLNRYFALEAGYSYFFNLARLQSTTGDTTTVWDKVSTQAVDVMAKIKAPVVDNFDLYAKVGVDYLMSNLKQQGTTDEGGIWASGHRNVFNVAYGAGADYYITPNVIANVEWLRFNGSAKIASTDDAKKYQPYTDAFMIGLRYKFEI